MAPHPPLLQGSFLIRLKRLASPRPPDAAAVRLLCMGVRDYAAADAGKSGLVSVWLHLTYVGVDAEAGTDVHLCARGCVDVRGQAAAETGEHG